MCKNVKSKFCNLRSSHGSKCHRDQNTTVLTVSAMAVETSKETANSKATYNSVIHITLFRTRTQTSPVSFWPIRWIHGPVWWVCGARRVLLIEILTHTSWGSPGILILVLCITSLALVSLLHPCQHHISYVSVVMLARHSALLQPGASAQRDESQLQ